VATREGGRSATPWRRSPTRREHGPAGRARCVSGPCRLGHGDRSIPGPAAPGVGVRCRRVGVRVLSRRPPRSPPAGPITARTWSWA